MKELRPPSSGRSEIRILLVFDPWRAAILLVAGDESGQWDKWYRTAIPRAERLYDDYLAERKKELEPRAERRAGGIRATWSALLRRPAARGHSMPPSPQCSMMPAGGAWLRCARGAG
jgi:Phage derived protein Gp49-like (DUF891)